MSWLSSALHWWAVKEHHEAVTPLLTVVAATGVAIAALLRHFAQTNADRERRITESFSKAVEQLGSDKVEVRLGGIYGLERISKESADDYWTVMETLTAFVRERTRWNKPDGSLSDSVVRLYAESASETDERRPPPTDISAVLVVINRRSDTNKKREEKAGWRLDLSKTDLRQASLVNAPLKGAILSGACLELADLTGAHLEDAEMMSAHLEGAKIWQAHLDRAFLAGTHFEGAELIQAHLGEAILWETHLEGADLTYAHLEDAQLMQACLGHARMAGAHLERADLNEAHLEGTDLKDTFGLVQEQLDVARGDAKTVLPPGLQRPAHWMSAEGTAPA